VALQPALELDSIAVEVTAPGWRARLMTLGALLILADAFDRILIAVVGVNALLLPGLPYSRLLLLPVFTAAGWLLAGHLRSAANNVRAAWPLWPVLGLSFLSVAWSAVPTTTLLWAIALLGVSAFGVALAVRFSPQDQAALVAATGAIIALGSIMWVLLLPGRYGPWSGAWEGLYVHKNLLGRIVALGVVAAAVDLAIGHRRPLALLAFLLCFGVTVASRSQASLLDIVVAVAAAMLLLGARRWPRQATVILAGGAAAIGVALILLLATPAGLALLTRSYTFNGRTVIWKLVTASAMQKPWFGHGYGAFWPSAPGLNVAAAFYVPINHAHNGFLDVFAELGVAGVVLVCVPLAVIGFAACRQALRSRDDGAIWPAVYLVFFVASNAAESGLLRHKIYWALYAAAACHVASNRSGRAVRADHAPVRG